MNLPAPSAGLPLPLLQEFLKTFEVSLDATSDDAEHIAEVFCRSFGFIVHFDMNLRSVGIDRPEVNDPDVPSAVRAAPGNPFIGQLLENLSIPFFALPADFSNPMQSLIVQLLDIFHALHELWKVLKLGPLVINLLYRGIDINTL